MSKIFDYSNYYVGVERTDIEDGRNVRVLTIGGRELEGSGEDLNVLLWVRLFWVLDASSLFHLRPIRKFNQGLEGSAAIVVVCLLYNLDFLWAGGNGGHNEGK